jgi:hypothetical protein
VGTTETAARWDVYREIHKAMRFGLFGVTTMAGNTDASDDAALRRLLDEWRAVTFILAGHHAHEDDFCDALVQKHAPDLREELEIAHRKSDAAIEALQQLASRLESAPPTERGQLVQAFYLDLADFTAFYMTHLRFEEDRVMPTLNEFLTNEELESVTNNIRGSVPPPDMCVFIRYMIPAMNFSERRDMLGGMFAGAPPEIFEMFRAAAEGCLSTSDYRAVAEAAGFA